MSDFDLSLELDASDINPDAGNVKETFVKQHLTTTMYNMIGKLGENDKLFMNKFEDDDVNLFALPFDTF